MHLHSIILDGFKSYEIKTKIIFDPHFNCITGLNGSGKSNILDGIIFVLGIESLKLLRVNTYKELINVNKKEAIVTIIFNNYEISRYILCDGKTKYTVNGSSCTTETVKKIFGSINLRRVGKTPYFVVMQGHITKILDMKTENLKELIEETAGIREYQIERQKAMVALEKKEIKLRETKESIQRRLTPFFDRLRNEREIYLKQKSFRDRENIIKKRIDNLKIEINNSNMNKNLNFLQILIREKKIKNSELEEIKNHINELKKDTSEDSLQNLNYLLDQEIVKLKLNRSNDLKNEILNKKIELDKIQIPYIQNIEDLKEKEKFLLQQNKQIEMYGINLDKQMDTICELEAKQKILEDNFFEIKKIILNDESLTEIHNSILNIKNSNDFKKLIDNSENKFNQKLIKILKEYSKDLEIIQNIKMKNEKINNLQEKYQNILDNLNYPLIEGVYGTVDENFQISDKKYKVAISCALGSRGKYVIVENENIGKDVLKICKKRISIIPLNKITPQKSYNKGKRLIDVINYEPKLKNAMEFIFGNFYIFENREEAKKSCFENNILTITLDGTIYNPKGTLSGGKYYVNEIINRKNELFQIESQIKNIENEIFTILNENQHLITILNKNSILKKQEKFNETLKNVNFIQNKLFSNEKLLKKILRIFEEYSENIKKIEIVKNLKGENIKKELENVRKIIIEEIKKTKIKNEIEKQIENINKEINSLEDEYQNEIIKRQEILNKKNEIEEMIKGEERRKSIKMINERDIENLENKLKNLNKIITELTMKIKKTTKKIITEIQNNDSDFYFYNKNDESIEMSKIMDKNDSFLINTESPFQNYEKIELKLIKKHLENILQIKNQDLNLEEINLKNNELNSADFILNLETQKINEDENELKKEYEELKTEYENLKNEKQIVINDKNFEILDQNDEKIANLEQKVIQIESDKIKIKKSIEKYNDLSKNEFIKALNHINSKIGLILNEFIPNSDVKITNDFELKVKIKNWKTKNELSGGQRSLVALSLIFSILTYNPSPFYIFDEIDSALDLNFTESIGRIIRKEFFKSQFIVVTLKDNLFRNANKIYQIYVEDGKNHVKCIKE